MRTIIFKAKRIDTGAWVTGFYVCLKDPMHKREKHFIYEGYAESECLDTDEEQWSPDKVEVDPATVCQYTGEEDNTGECIFEGDIVEFNYYRKKRKGYVSYGLFGFIVENNLDIRNNLLHAMVMYQHACVIGNIHDNPEMVVK